MEYQFNSFQILLTFLLFVLMILKIRKMSKTSRPKLPPGPWKLPLIGNMHQIGSSPHISMTDLAKKYGPLMHLQLGEVPHIVASSPDTAKAVYKHYDINFAQRPPLLAFEFVTHNYIDMVFSPYGDYWRQLRKIATLELLSVKRVQSFGSIRKEELSNVIRSIYSNAGLPINFSKMMTTLTNDVTARAAFGDRCKDQDAFLPASEKLVELAAGFSIVDVFPSIKLLQVLTGMRSKLLKCSQEIDKSLDNIIKDHKARRTTRKIGEGQEDDLVHVLLNLMEKGDLELPLTDDGIKAIIMDIFVAGTETSSTTIIWVFSELLKNPRVLEKAQEEVRRVFHKQGDVDEAGLHELEYLQLVIKETFRLHPPVPLILPRECRESCKINGYDIPLGYRLIVNIWALGRDPNYWTEPESFYPERFLGSSIDYKGVNYELLPFGGGRRICPGMTFGIANVEFPLAKLLYHFNWKLPNGVKNEDLDMTEKMGAAVGRKNDLYLIPIPHPSRSS